MFNSFGPTWQKSPVKTVLAKKVGVTLRPVDSNEDFGLCPEGVKEQVRGNIYTEQVIHVFSN